MTEKEIREKVIDVAQAYLGAKEGGKLHKQIIDIFNTVKPDGASMTYSAPWCASFVSGVEIEALGKTDAKKICPLSYNCGTIIDRAKALGSWVEDDAYKPKIADWILYDWQDSGKGDNTGGADHVGIVEKVSGKKITVIEGNKNDKCERRTLAVNGKYIRGYVAIPYNKLVKKKKTLKVGSRIKIKKGANQYGTPKAFASYVYGRTYKVIEIRGSRVVFATTDGKTVMGAVNKSDCKVQ